jgi:hypothetical protein
MANSIKFHSKLDIIGKLKLIDCISTQFKNSQMEKKKCFAKVLILLGVGSLWHVGASPNKLSFLAI